MLSSGGCRILNNIVRGATVDLFHSSAIATAPVERLTAKSLLQLPEENLKGLIAVVGSGFDASLILSVPESVFRLVPQNPARPFSATDWTLEQTNQLLGRIKSRLAQFQVTFRPSLPSTPSEESWRRLARESNSFFLYEFRTLRGLIFVVLCGSLKLQNLDYSNFITNAHEGDIILF